MTLIPKFANAHPHPSRPTLGALLGIPATVGSAADDSITAADAFNIAVTEARRFPLQKVEARARIVGDCAITELSEHYHNPHDIPLDVTHLIPLPASGAVIGFEIRAGGRVSRGVCKPNQVAQADFDSARSRGKSAALVRQVRDDEHRISLANVPPQTDVVVTLRIAERLRVDDGRFEYRLPTTIARRYVPGETEIGHAGPGWSADTPQAPDASHRTPPVMLAGRIPLDLEVRIAAGVTQVLPSIALDRTDEADGTVVLRPAERQSCDGDVVIRYWGRGERTQLRAYTDGERTLVIADPPADRVPELERVREAIFVLDRSGSMSGKPIDAAKAAVIAALRQLKPTDRVQIIAFDTLLEAFPSKPEAATPPMIRKAISWVKRVTTRGGTKAMPALTAACRAPAHPGHVRTVLFVTDGHVANDEEIVRFTQRVDPAVRISVVGIGAASQHAMLHRLARLGGGSYAAINESDDIERETAAIGATMLGPIACGLHEASGAESTFTDLFAGRAATVFVEGARTSVRVTSLDGSFDLSCDVVPSPMPLGALWARDRVERLEDARIANPGEADTIDAQIEALGVTHQLQTRMTAFVAVDESSQMHGEALEIEQPVEEVRDMADASGFGDVCYSPDPNICYKRVPSDRDVRYSIADSRPRRPRPKAGPRLSAPPTPRTRLQSFLDMDTDDDYRGNAVVGDQAMPEPWTRCAIEDLERAYLLKIVAEATPALLRKMFVAFDRFGDFLAKGLSPNHDHVSAAAILVMLEAFHPSRCRTAEFPGQYIGLDLTRGGPLWMQCMERLQPVASKPGWKGFVGAARRGAFTEMCRRAKALEGRV